MILGCLTLAINLISLRAFFFSCSDNASIFTYKSQKNVNKNFVVIYNKDHFFLLYPYFNTRKYIFIFYVQKLTKFAYLFKGIMVAVGMSLDKVNHAEGSLTYKIENIYEKTNWSRIELT